MSISYDEFLQSHPATYRMPLHENTLTYEGVNLGWDVANDADFAPTIITNLRGRHGLATRIYGGGGISEPSLIADQAIHFVLYMPKTYDGVPVGLYSNGGLTYGFALILDDFDLVLIATENNVGYEVARRGLLGHGTYSVLIDLDVTGSGNGRLFLNGVMESSGTFPVTTDSGLNPQIGGADTRYPANTFYDQGIDGSRILISEFLHWVGADRTALFSGGDGAISDLYKSLMVAPTIPVDLTVSAPQVTIGSTPPIDIMTAFESEVVRPIRWVDIYDSDNQTIMFPKVPIQSGTVSIDMDRDERRNLDLSISDHEELLGYGPTEFWYDKFIWPYRGIELANGDQWVTPLGQFMPDTINRPHFPRVLSVNCRDLTKKLLLDKFADTTSFAAGLNIGTVISAIATNGGITNQTFATTTKTLSVATTFDRGMPRFQAMKDLATSIGYELYFNAAGSLVFRPFVDPITAPLAMTFQDGPDSNLASYDRSTTDTRLFNDIIVYGTSGNNSLVWARAQNVDPLSPTRISKVGQRTKPMPLQHVPDNATAQSIADSFLKVSGLEQYDVNLSGIVLPWLDVGEAIEFNVSTSRPSDPTRFLLATLTIPMALEAMSSTARRVTNVG